MYVYIVYATVCLCIDEHKKKAPVSIIIYKYKVSWNCIFQYIMSARAELIMEMIGELVGAPRERVKLFQSMGSQNASFRALWSLFGASEQLIRAWWAHMPLNIHIRIHSYLYTYIYIYNSSIYIRQPWTIHYLLQFCNHKVPS